LYNISCDPTSREAELDKMKIDLTLYNIQSKKVGNTSGEKRAPDHEDRTSFTTFIRTAQHNIFHPDRPKLTGIFLLKYVCCTDIFHLF
jgi:hypothetical protein